MSDTDTKSEPRASDTVFDKRYEGGKHDSDGSYSDSDDDKLQSMFSVIQPGHVPGKYKLSAETDNQEDREIKEKPSSLDDGGLGNTNDDRITEKIDDAEDHDQNTTGDSSGKSMLDTDLFCKSMVFIEKDELEECSLKQTSRPPLPPKPVKVPSSSPGQPPKPAPRRKRIQKLSTEQSTEEEKTTTPSPRIKRKRSSSTTEQVSNENSGEKETDGMGDTADTTEKETEDTEPDNLEDTVDFGPAEEGELVSESKPEETDDKVENMNTFVIHEQPATSGNHGEEQTEEDEKALSNEDVQGELRTLDSDGSNAGEQSDKYAQKGTGGKTEESDSGEEQADRFDNNFQDSSSLEDSTDEFTDGDYKTPNIMSADEDEVGNKDTRNGHNVNLQNIENAEKNSELRGNGTFTMTLSSRLGESFVVIGTETLYKGYESLSSTAASGDLPKSSECDHDEENVMRNRNSVRNMKNFFERMSIGSSTNTEKHESKTNDSSYDVLSYTNKSSYSSEHTVDVDEEIKTEPVQHTSVKAEKKLEVADTEEDFTKPSFDVIDGRRSPSVVVPTTEENTVAENNFVEKETHEAETVKAETADADVEATEEVPPPVGPRSMQVLESLKTLISEYDKPPHIPPKSIPPEKDRYNEEYGEYEAWTNVMKPNTSEWSEENMAYMHYNQKPTHAQGFPPTGPEGHSEQGIPNQYASFAQQPPFYIPKPQQQQQYTPTGQPYFYCDQEGNPQYPYAFYPQMYGGLYYQTQGGPFYQQPYFYMPHSMQQQAHNYNAPESMEQPSQQYGTHNKMQQSPQREIKESPAPHQHATREHVRLQTTSPLTVPNVSQPRTTRDTKTSDDDGYTEIKDEEIRRTVESRDELSLKSKKTESRNVTSDRRPSIPEKPKAGNAEPKVPPKREPKKTAPVKEEKDHHTGRKTETKAVEERKPKTPEEHYLFFKGLNPATNKEVLGSLVEIISGFGEVDTESIIFNASKDCALVVSLKKPDLVQGRERIKTKKIEGYIPELFEVDPPKCIAVSCEEGIKNLEGLELYFEHSKAGGDEVVGTSYETEDGSCIVIEFKDPAVVKRVCEKGKKTPHRYDGKPLRVSPFYKCQAGEIWDSDLHVVRMPEPIIVKLNGNCLQFLQRGCCKQLMASLKENYCTVTFSEEALRLGCTLTSKVDNFRARRKDWEASSRHIVEEYIQRNLTELDMRVQGEHQEQVFVELKQYFDSENAERMQELVVTIKDKSREVCLFGFAEAVNRLHSALQEKKFEIEKRLRRTKQTLPYDSLKLRLLEAVGAFNEMLRNLEDVEIYFGDRDLTVEGQPEDITTVRLKLYEVEEHVKEFHWDHGFTRHCVDFIKMQLVPKVDAILKENGVFAVWEMDVKKVYGFTYEGEVDEKVQSEEDHYTSCRFDENVYHYASVGEMGTHVKHWFKKILAEESEHIPDKILATPEGEEFLQDITERYDRDAGTDVTDDGRKIFMFGMTKEVKEIHNKVYEFLDKNVVKQEEMKSGTIEIKLITRHMTERIKEVEKSLNKQKVFFELKGDTAIIWGTREGISKAKDALRKIFESITCEEHSIQKVAVKDVIRTEKENGTIDLVENQTKCIIQLPGEFETTFDRTQHPKHESRPGHIRETESYSGAVEDVDEEQKKRRPQTKPVFEAANGVKITLVKGEIGKQDGHVIVVTTSPNLNLSSGAACKSILTAGGKTLQDECKAKYPEGIKNGEIAVINGGNGLECNNVYLTSLPNWGAIEENPKQTLQKVMATSLEMASKHQKMSILFCAMGTGQLKYPHEVVAMEMYQSVIDFASNHPGTTLKDVRFVLYQGDWATIKAFEEEERIRTEGHGVRPTYELKRGVINIQVAVENIAEQKVDGIVCSVAGDLNLSRQGACSALLRAGGQVLQDECRTKYNNSLDSEQVAEISGGNLPCKTLFLTVLPQYTPEAGGKLTKVMETCLQLAQAKGLKSLAFPALGAGHLKYPPDEVCHYMFETVSKWGINNPTTSVRTVRFIMHAKDRALIQRFKAHVQYSQGRGNRKERTLSQDASMPSGQIPKGDYNATDREFYVRGIKLEVQTGDILEQKVDMIVCSVNEKFEFVGGVANALKQKYPKVVEEAERKQAKFQKEGLAVTKSYGLPANKIIHVKFVETPAKWNHRMLKCLEKANKKGCKKIAFPLLGTGQGPTTLDPGQIAAALFDAVDELVSHGKKITIKHVSLVIFKTQLYMMKSVVESLHKSVQKAVEGKHAWSWGEKAKGVFKSAYSLVTGSTPGALSKDDFEKMRQQKSSLTLKIYSDSKENIQKCIRELDLKLEEQYTKMRIDDYKELIKSLTPEEEKELENTEIIADMKLDKAAGIITIEGPVRAVGDVKSQLQSRLLKIDRRRSEANIAEENYKLFRWYFEEITETGIEHLEYEKVLNLRIEQAYKANRNEVEFHTDKGEAYIVDLLNLVEYPKNDEKDTVKVLRKDILKQATAALPAEWAPMKDGENLRRVNIPNTEKTFKDIEQRFLTEVKSGQYTGRITFDKNKLQVSKIERIQNKTLYQQYMAKKRLISEQKPNLPAGMPIEQELWHGTSHDAVDSIEMHGFNRSYCGKNGIWFGAGVYFAKCASYSARGWLSGANPGVTGVKGYIFLTKVLTGQYCKGNDKMRYLPPVDPTKPTVLYDCAVDNVANPMEFVIFHDTQAYPEYIVTFTA